MKPLFILIATFFISLVIGKFITGFFDYSMAGRIAMSVMLLFTAIGHFVLTNGMALMLPAIIPFKKQIIYFTGVIEIAAAIGLLLPQVRHLTALLLILFFILILPANIHAASRRVNFEKGTFDGPGLRYLWFRIPLQVLFILWTWWFALRQ